MFKNIGVCHTKSDITKSQYLFGLNSEISNKKLATIERNSLGDCLCLLNYNLVTIRHDDVASYTPTFPKTKLFNGGF